MTAPFVPTLARPCVLVLDYQQPTQRFWNGGGWSSQYPDAHPYGHDWVARRVRRNMDIVERNRTSIVANYGLATERRV